MKEIKIRDEYIKLGQAMKLCGAVQSGLEAKEYIINGEVEVNGQKEIQRGKKLHDGDIFLYNGNEYKIKSSLTENKV